VSGSPSTRTFRGSSFAELLPEIQAELGSDAVITRRREGIVGGIGGFFGRRCVEVEARPARPAISSMPDALDVYDSGDDPDPALEERLPTFADDPFAAFATTLVAAAQVLEEEAPEPRSMDPLGPEDDPLAIERRLAACGIPQLIVERLLEEAVRHRAAFSPDRPLRLQVRRALHGALRVRHGWAGRRRRVALVGATASAPSTLIAGRLCNAYARAPGAGVGLIGMRPARESLRLAELTRADGVELEVASTPSAVLAAVAALRGADLIVAEAPALEAGDRRAVARVAARLASFRAHETHLVVPAALPQETIRLLLRELEPQVRVNRLLVSLDDEPGVPTAVGASIATGIPISYLSSGDEPDGGLRVAEPAELARLLLP